MASCGSMTFTKQKRKKISAESKMTNWFLTAFSGTIASPFLLLIAVLSVRYDSVAGVFVQTPTNKTVIANHSTSFNCSTNNSNLGVGLLPLTWYHYPVGDTTAKGVYEREKIRTKYEGRFDVEQESTSGALNLLVQIPNREDAGTYQCREDPYVPGASASLTILDSNPFCESNMSLQEVVGYTQCIKPIDPDKMMLSCRVNYSGNTAPRMTWIRKDTTSELNTTCEDRDKLVICNTTLDGNLVRDGSVFVCQIKTAEQYSCSLKVNKTISAALASTTKTEYRIEDEVTCVANASSQLSCSYTWLTYNSTEVSANQTFKPKDPGSYRCRVQCQIRNNSICEFTAMDINVTSVHDQGSNLKPLWCLLPIGIVIIIGIFLAIRYKDSWLRRCRKNDAPSPRENEMELRLLTARDPLLKDRRKATPPRTPLYHLPLEVMDIILLKSYLHWTLNSSTKQRDEEVIRSLTSVDVCFYRRIYKPRFKKVIWRYLKGLLTARDPLLKDRRKATPPRTPNKTDLERFVEEACNDKSYIVGKGLNGDLYGPRVYKGRLCAFEKVTFTLDQCKSTREGEEETERDQFLIKCEEWKALRHKNVMKFYYVVKLPSAVVIVMKHAAGGNVRAALKTLTEEDLPPAVVICWAQQIAQGMKCLHENNIIHGYLKCARISIMVPVELCTPENAKLKITCNRLACKKNATSSKMTEDIEWKAPLAMFSKDNITKRCDVWSFGVTVWEILTRKIPHQDKSIAEKVKKIPRGKLLVPIPESCPRVLRDLFTECFDQRRNNSRCFGQNLGKEETTFDALIKILEKKKQHSAKS